VLGAHWLCDLCDQLSAVAASLRDNWGQPSVCDCDCDEMGCISHNGTMGRLGGRS